MPDAARLRRLRFRAWHRGTREADYIMGSFFDLHHAAWGEDAVAWFEALLREEDPDVLDWIMGASEPPPQFAGPLMEALRRLDYVTIPR